MPTREQARKAWEHGRKSEQHYDGMTDEQKTAMWQFGRDNGYISPDTLNGRAKEEFNKYVKTPWVRYEPEVSKDNMPEALKVDKYAAYEGPKIPLKNLEAPKLKIPAPKADRKLAKDLYDRVAKEGNFDSLTEEGKQVYLQYRHDQGLLPMDRLTEQGRAEIERYVDTKNLYYAPEAAALKTVKENKLDKVNGQIVGVHTEEKTIKTGGEYDRHALSKPYISTPVIKKPEIVAKKDIPLTEADKYKSLSPMQKIVKSIQGYVPPKEYLDEIERTAAEKAKTEAEKPVRALQYGFLNSASLDTLNKGTKSQLGSEKGLADISSEKHPVLTGAGTVAGYALPFNTATKATAGITKALTKGLSSKLGKEIIKGAVAGSVLDTAEGALDYNSKKTVGENAKDIGNRTLRGAALGIGGDLLLAGAGKGLKKIVPKIGESLALKPPKIEPKQLDNISTPKIKNNGLKPNLETPKLPKKEQMSLPNSIVNSELSKPELKAELNNKNFEYTPVTNKETLENAKKLINTDYDQAIKIVKEGPATAESNVVGMELVNKLQEENRYTEAIDIIETISRKATESGQAIQALSMWGRLTPEGMLKYTQSMIDKANDELTKQGFKDIKKLKLTEEFAKDITERMKAIGSMAEGRVKTVEIAKVLRDIDEQLPKDVWRKVSTVQTMAQLLNPKTMVRNFAGNAIFGGLENISNVIGTPIDKVISGLTGQRTTILPSIKTQLAAGKVDLVEAVQDALMGIDTKGIGQKFDLGKGPTFKNNTLLGKLEKGMNIGLKATDAAFSGAARAESLRQQMKIAGVTEPTPGMIEIADKIAKYRTFQDKNGLSKGFNDIKAGLNKLSSYFTGTTEWGLGDLVIKYTTTPANILSRGIEYSPLGAVKSINEAFKPLRGKAFNQKEFVDTLSRSATGTSLIVLGYQLNKMGLITGAADKDQDVAAMQRDIGKGEYKLNTTALGRYLKSFDEAELKPKAGDTFASWDWTAPTSIMLGIGANISQNKGNTTDLLTTLVNATASGMNTIFEQPLLTGVKKFTGGYDQTQNLINTVQGLPSSFVPSILNQTKQLTDNKSRNTYDPNMLKETVNTVKAKIPALSKTLQPRINTLGKEKETFMSGSNSLFNVLLNPSNTSKYTPTPAAEMVLDIYEKSGEKIQFPRVAMTYVMVKGEKINLMPDEVTKLQTIMGEKTAKAFDQVAKNKSFRASAPEAQAKKLQSMLTEISQDAKQQILRDILKRRNKQ